MKPGCIPPYVALDLGVTKEDVLNAETQYLRDKIRRPYFNDLIYFFKAIYKIIFEADVVHKYNKMNFIKKSKVFY